MNKLSKLLSNKKFKLIIKILISIIFITFLITTLKPNEIYKTFLESNKVLFSIALLMVIPNIFFQFAKWKLISGKLLFKIPNKNLVVSIFHGFTAGVITPLRVGEYVGRGLPFKELNVIKVFTAIFIDKFFNLIVITIVGGISFLYFVLNKQTGIQFSINDIVYPSIILMGFLIFLIVFRSKLLIRLRKISLIRKIVESFESIKQLTLRETLTGFFYAGMFFFTYLTQFVILLYAFSEKIDPILFYTIAASVMFVKTVIPQFTFGDLGLREGAAIYFVTLAGLQGAVGFNAAISLFFINIILPSIVGLFFVMKREA